MGEELNDYLRRQTRGARRAIVAGYSRERARAPRLLFPTPALEHPPARPHHGAHEPEAARLQRGLGDDAHDLPERVPGRLDVREDPAQVLRGPGGGAGGAQPAAARWPTSCTLHAVRRTCRPPGEAEGPLRGLRPGLRGPRHPAHPGGLRAACTSPCSTRTSRRSWRRRAS